MPSYRTHININLSLGLPLSIAALKYTAACSLFDMFCFAIAFCYGTFLLHPDLDLARNIRLFSLKGILTLPFRPYSYFFRHRGISHLPVIGTLTRVLWLLGCLYFAFFLLDKAIPHLHFWNQPLVWFGVAGLAVADLLHVFLDYFY
jgi:uncharacterized metal-binding protein